MGDDGGMDADPALGKQGIGGAAAVVDGLARGATDLPRLRWPFNIPKDRNRLRPLVGAAGGVPGVDGMGILSVFAGSTNGDGVDGVCGKCTKMDV